MTTHIFFEHLIVSNSTVFNIRMDRGVLHPHRCHITVTTYGPASWQPILISSMIVSNSTVIPCLGAFNLLPTSRWNHIIKAVMYAVLLRRYWPIDTYILYLFTVHQFDLSFWLLQFLSVCRSLKVQVIEEVYKPVLYGATDSWTSTSSAGYERQRVNWKTNWTVPTRVAKDDEEVIRGKISIHYVLVLFLADTGAPTSFMSHEVSTITLLYSLLWLESHLIVGITIASEVRKKISIAGYETLCQLPTRYQYQEAPSRIFVC
jgi:hypothetical protein